MADVKQSELDLWSIRGTGLYPTSNLTFSIQVGAATLVGTVKLSFIFNL